MPHSLTIGFCTPIKDDPFSLYLQDRVGNRCDLWIMPKICSKNGRNINVAYNQIISESINDTIILCHNDITFLGDTDIAAKINSLFAMSPDTAIIGVVGGDSISYAAPHWCGYKNRFGHIVQGFRNGSQYDRYDNYVTPNIILQPALTVDGLFLAIRRDRIKAKFDENLKTFHFYDMCFCIDNHLAGCKIGVTKLISIRHGSTGHIDDAWKETAEYFRRKYKDYLPIEI